MKNSFKIRGLRTHEPPPIDLLLLADPSEEQISTYVHKSKILIAEVNQQLMGVCALVEGSSNNCEIQNIAVAESAQGQGIGTQLLRRAINHARMKNAKVLTICTADTSKSQQQLYQKVGFRIDSIDKDYFVKQYTEPIYENGIQCKDRLILKMNFD